mmetsp:Transcript_13510/g.44655  ORF Transcript_13510/g.44655 Transcript_13510/m.44655 type:complete len:271 (-) Transcript_13510:247-1059(-)
MFHTIPVARSMPRSRRGEEIAAAAASRARFLPVARPIPISDDPASAITARTSAKSTLIKPGRVMMSQMPRTPCLKMSSANRKASCTGSAVSTALNRRSLGITIRVSTLRLNRSTASMAWLYRCLPSNLNGIVTMPTVRMPAAFATPATTGAAPDPVPPPIPAVTNTMSLPASACSMLCRDSSAAFWPISGFPPAPRPLVSSLPIWMWLAWETAAVAMACESVLTIQNSTPLMSLPTMRFTALDPPPPTPTTLILAALNTWGGGVCDGAGA